MKRPLFFLYSVLAVLLLYPAMAQTEASSCRDDKRLEQLPEFLSSSGAVKPPLQMIPETFLRLAPEAAETLGDSLRICPDIPVTPQGLALFPLEVDIPLLLEQVNICAYASDWKCLERLRCQFRVRPLPAAAVPSLIMQLRGNAEEKRQIGKVLGATVRQGGTLLYTDIFLAFGGKVTNAREAVVIPAGYEDVSWVKELRAEVMASLPHVLLVSVAGQAKPVIDSLLALGFTPMPIEMPQDAPKVREQLFSRQ